MFESLQRIKNPFARSVTAAVTTFSAVTLAASIAIGTAKAKDDAAYKTAFYAAFIGAGCAALFGFVSPGKRSLETTAQSSRDQQTIAAMEWNTWTDWRNFVVVRKVKESEEITSFYLEPEDKGAIPNFQPGQFLTIKLDIPGQARPVIRTYSLSDYAEPHTYYRLSIKREPMPAGLDVMPGIASNFMHNQIQEGSVILAKPPSGKFVLDVHQMSPVVLISNGVGITPMISMAKALTHANATRPIWFLHGARDGRFHAFRDEVNTIAEKNPGLKVHYAYSRPREEDAGHYHSVGYVDVGLIQSLMIQDADYFLCGSPPFMDSIREGLKAAGVPENRVFFEMFTKAAKATIEPPSSETTGVEGADVVFAQSNKTALWQVEAGSLLEFAEANELNPPYSCRQGICGTCQCKVLEGEVDYLEAPTAAIDEGSVLICISKPKTSRLVLDL
ncbi:MAG: 2Fe-2S iron-sulfur cluster-binding protein [Leptolyngbya sp. BL-A-14]